MDSLLKNGAQIYAFVYFGGIIAVALLESVLPRRVPGATLGLRWFGNFSLTIIGAVMVRVLFPLAGVGWAVFCSERRLGLFNQLAWPWLVEFSLTIVVIDLAYYLQHYVLHRVPMLWRMHRTHHTDQEYDFSTGVRFHPFEAVYTTTAVIAVIVALGAPPMAVFVSQLLSIGVAFFEHANVRMPGRLDRALRLLIVTPDMHRIHHSQDIHEGESNFANMFSFWDRLFGTYVDQPAAGHDGIVFGVPGFSERKHLTLPWMLVQPFLGHQRHVAGPDEPEAASAGTDVTAAPRA
jgi:sterol desaturase/sphingolipid hydroxylase (fatty acid hydroxylase superfamily)